MNAICLVMDRLHAGYLGAYGNTWIETPTFDRLAAESFMFDQALIDTPDLERLYRSYWQGLHALCPQDAAGRPTLPGLLREAGVSTTLLTDERLVRDHPLAIEFDDLVEIDPPWQPQMVDEGSLHETHLARCFVEILDRLQTAEQPFLLWCHLGSLGTTWDAPLEFRKRYWEEGDPEPSRSADPPEGQLEEDHDPDDVLGFSQAYAGQVSLWDACLEGLCEVLEEHKAVRETLVVLTSARGLPLGSHRRLGPCDDALYSELVQVPLLLRFPDRLGASDRSQALVEPADLWATLLDWWQLGDPRPTPSAASLMPLVRGQIATIRDRLVVAGRTTERAIRTPAWHLRAAAEPELFTKPDDWWEANNVAIRCREVVECLHDSLVQFEQTIRTGRVCDLPPLSDVLLRGLD